MKAVITAGGHGTRLRPITWTTNKHLIPLANEPMLFNALKKVALVGVRDVAINVNPGETELIRNACGNGSRFGLSSIAYLEQEGGAVGVGQILWSAREWIGDDDVLLYFGDNVVLGSLQKLVDAFYEGALDASFAFVEVSDPQRFGVPEFDANGSLVRIHEKPEHPPSSYAQTGLYVYKMPKYLEAFANIKPSPRGEYEISDINSYLVANGKAGYRVMHGWWKDTGTPEALLEGNQLLLNEMTIEEATIDASARVSSAARIQGRVKIGAGTTIGEGVLVRGPVVIGDRVTVERAFVGPHTTLGDGVIVQGAEIEHTIVMEGARIATASRIVDSIVGPRAVVQSAVGRAPRGHSMVVGEDSYIEL